MTQQTDSNDPQNWANQYDQEGKLTGVNVTDTVTSAVLHQYAYLYDAAGNRTSEQIDGNVTGASYNSLNQLTGQSAGGKMVFSGSLSKLSQVTVGGNAATTSYSTNFSGVANVTSGTNTVAVVAHDVNNNTSTNNYQVVIPPSSAAYTYDLNGNLMTDATRTYAWDAKNELVSIVYTSGPNAGTHTEFTYDGAGDRVKIVERSGTVIGSGTITSTKQYAGNEELDGTGTVTKRYFSQGEQRIVSGVTTNYFYTRDHLGSIREMVASDGSTIVSRYSYDPYGRATQVSGSLSCDFQYDGMYMHVTSGLNLTQFRAYNPNTGTWISRDPSGEGSGLNLYAYCADDPINFTDRLGLDRNPYERAAEFAGGTALVVLGIAGIIILAPAEASLALASLTIAIFVGTAQMAAAFLPNTPEMDQRADIIDNAPTSLPEAVARAAGGQDAQDAVALASAAREASEAKTALNALASTLDALKQILDKITKPKPNSKCIDAPPIPKNLSGPLS